MENFIRELRQRKVVRVIGAYLVISWILVQIATTLEESLLLPAWFDSVVVALLIVGLPIAIIVAWIYDVTPDGVVRTEGSGHKLNFLIATALVVVGVIAALQFMDKGEPVAAPAEAPARPLDSVSAATIAVLPFADLSPAGDQEYFSDGISEEILNLLASVDQLNVTSRTSAFQFKGRDLGIPEIAASLKVRHVVEGSIRKAGETIRITVQLIDASDDRHLWSQTFDRPLTAENVFAIQDEIANAIVAALSETLGLENSSDITVKAGTNNLTAYEQYLQARWLYQTRVELDVADDLLAAALEQDPLFAAAWEIRAALQFLMESYGFRSSSRDEIVRLTYEYANQALALEPESSTAIATKAFVLIYGSRSLNHSTDFSKVLADLTRAIEIDPRNDSALNWRGITRLAVGDVDGAIDDFTTCIEYEPLTTPCAENYINATAGAGRDEDAFRQFSRLLDYGVAKSSEADLPMLARLGKETVFKLAANDDELLFGWNESDALYHAFRNPSDDHSRLAKSIMSFFDANPVQANLARTIILSYLGVYRDGIEYQTMWPIAHTALRQSEEFRTFIRQSGILTYWQEQGFPPQCRAANEDDFQCD